MSLDSCAQGYLFAEYSDWVTNLDDPVKALAPLPLAHQDEVGDDEIDEIAVTRHRGWLWKGS